MQEPVRATLWQLHASLALLPPTEWPAALAARERALADDATWAADTNDLGGDVRLFRQVCC